MWRRLAFIVTQVIFKGLCRAQLSWGSACENARALPRMRAKAGKPLKMGWRGIPTREISRSRL
jgi:hypothetical protein